MPHSLCKPLNKHVPPLSSNSHSVSQLSVSGAESLSVPLLPMPVVPLVTMGNAEVLNRSICNRVYLHVISEKLKPSVKKQWDKHFSRSAD